MELIAIEAYERIVRICEIALAKKTLAVIHGLAGTGKSTALMEFQGHHEERVVYIRADPTLSKREMLREICVALDLSPTGTMRGMERRIEHEYGQKRSQHAILMDEADRLGGGSPLYWFEVLRTLYDLCPKLSMVFAGEEGLMDILERDPRMRDGFRRFYSRITARYATSTRSGRRWMLLGAEDVAKTLDAYGLGQIEDAARGRLKAIGEEGGVRKLCNTLENIQMLKFEGPVTARVVAAAENVLGM